MKMKWIYALVLVLLASVVLFAQPVAVTPTTPTEWYSSLGGVSVATLMAVAILKRALAKVPAFNRVPLWIYGSLVSAGLIYVTNQIWHTLPGSWGQLTMEAVRAAATATGIYEWLNSSDAGVVASITKPLGESVVAKSAGSNM